MGSVSIPARSASEVGSVSSRLQEFCSLDVFETREENGEAVAIRAAVYDKSGATVVEGEWAEIGIPEDEDSYDAALGWSCSTAELKLAQLLEAEGMSPEDAEEMVELELSRSDMPVY